MKNNQKGFSVIETLIILTVVIVIGGAGFYLYQRQNDKTTDKEQQNSSEKADSNRENEDEHDEAEVAATGYLEIQEWGIKLKLEAADKLTYQINDEPGQRSGLDEPYLAAASLYLSDTVTTNPDCQGLGLAVFQATEQSQHIASKKIGDYYYYITGGPGSCGVDNVDKVRSDIINQLNTVDVIGKL